MEFFFRQYGQGQPIIILHGWLGLSDHWMSVAKFLSEQGFNVIVPDLPNHGRSFHTEDFSFDEMAEIMYSFSLTQGFEDPILLAHSMGGKIAMKMVDKNPDYYKSLILIDIHFRLYERNPERDLFTSLLSQTNPSDFKDIRNFRNHFLDNGIEKDMVAVILKNVEYNKKTLQWKSNMPMLAREAEKVMQEVEISETNIPTLILRGENSNYIRDEDIITLKEKFKNSKIITVPKSGHLIHVDNPAFLLKEILYFTQE
ncbi:MAG: alpha/beta hydrolase [Bacteroidales bacterium]|nr:alpha/beta hydrolase [Bacteroidales bacterium]